MARSQTRTVYHSGAQWFCVALLALASAACSQQPRTTPLATQWSRVDYVVDGDTLVLADRRHVRLIGINSPERGRNGAADQPLARAAGDHLQHLVSGQTVRLTIGRVTHDRYGRVLAHIWLADGRSVQQELLARGLAVVVAIPPNISQLDAYQRAEQAARTSKLGIWAHPYYRPVPASRLALSDTGFRFVIGRVYNIRRSRRSIELELSSTLTVIVPRKDWTYFQVRPEALLGKRVSVRGWVAHDDENLRIRVHHPAMLTLLE